MMMRFIAAKRVFLKTRHFHQSLVTVWGLIVCVRRCVRLSAPFLTNGRVQMDWWSQQLSCSVRTLFLSGCRSTVQAVAVAVMPDQGCVCSLAVLTASKQ